MSRTTVLAVAVVAYIIALDPNSSIMGLVSNAWAGTWRLFGPIILMSLYWRRTNLAGAAKALPACVVGNNMGLHTAYKRRTLGDRTGFTKFILVL